MQTFSGLQYLQMDIAASFGHDDKTWYERLAWVESNNEKILDETDLMTGQAKEPAQFFAGVLAYKAALRGEPSGYLCGLDATASGIQLLSLLAGCEQSASLCNLVNTGRREDAYVSTHQHMNQLLNTDTALDRKPIKTAAMTHFYGSTAEPKKAFGEDTPELAAFYQTIDDLLPGADLLNKDLISLWNPEALSHNWTLPDGFDVVIKVMDTVDHQVTMLGKTYEIKEKVNRPVASGLSMGANIIHSIDGMVVREMNRRCNYDWNQAHEVMHLLTNDRIDVGTSTDRIKDLALLRILALYDETQFMSAVIFEYLDELNAGHLEPVHRSALFGLLASLPDKGFPIICIHDCFKFHPNYGNDVRTQYRQILAELAASDTLEAVATEIAGRPVHVTKLSNNLPALILESEFAIC